MLSWRETNLDLIGTCMAIAAASMNLEREKPVKQAAPNCCFQFVCVFLYVPSLQEQTRPPNFSEFIELLNFGLSLSIAKSPSTPNTCNNVFRVPWPAVLARVLLWPGYGPKKKRRNRFCCGGPPWAWLSTSLMVNPRRYSFI